MGAVPLSAQHAVGRLPGLKEPSLVIGPDARLWLIWLEQRPQERGRTTALIRRFGDSEATPQELTPAPCNLRSRVHDYGGGVLATAVEQDKLILTWIEQGCLWRQDWHLPQTSTDHPTPQAAAQRLSQEGDWELADGVLDLPRQRWIGIREINGRDELVTLKLNAKDQMPLLLHQPTDFAGYGCLSPDGQRFAWVEWQQPTMPWDSSSLWCAEFSDTGGLLRSRQLAGGDGISVFQPQWLPDGQLLVAEDSTGWWNLMLQPSTDAAWERPWPMAAETAMPQWIYGMSTTAWDGERLIAAVCSRGAWSLQRLDLDGTVPVSYTHLTLPTILLV